MRCKLALTGETYGGDRRDRNRDLAIGALATVYGLWLVYAAGLQYLLMCAILFAPGIIVYVKARSASAASAPSTASNRCIAAVIALLALLAAWLMWTGRISPI